MSLEKSRIDEIAQEMIRKFNGGMLKESAACNPNCLGIYTYIEDAIEAAKLSQKQLVALSIEHRNKIIAAMRKAAIENARKLAVMANEETGFGRVEDKVIKNLLAAEKTPGTEDLHTAAYTGDNGMTLIEEAPYGVIGAITPSTNPTATVINNSISMVAAGNGVVFNPHPSAKKATIEAISLLNEAIKSAGGPESLLCSVFEPTMETSKVIMEHKHVRILAVTGGEAVVNVAMRSGKKVIAAGPGNPPVIVDDTADIKKAAADITKGASFDNNILCIAEKEVFVFKSVADELIREMIKNNCYLANKAEIEKIGSVILEKDKNGKCVVNRKFVGKSASYILNASDIKVNEDYKLVLAEVDYNHPFVTTELLMPVLAISRVDSLDEAIDKAVEAENNCRHTAMMHSTNVNNLTLAARALDTTIFVKNAPSYAGLGIDGEGYTTLTIATPTGEGLTSAKSFVRLRRCTLSGSFRII
ncbi:aldehyde dehydrogenase family protein [Candidatus Clostridium stratigraminis]|uniref:Aldehyde dehydrogenase family protein n=1 Tax=Candidatus Clostridium stratigraminis TaxID=3381661 RepID=A0ABW8T862_9CLOT